MKEPLALLLAMEVVSTKREMEWRVETWRMESSLQTAVAVAMLAPTPLRYH